MFSTPIMTPSAANGSKTLLRPDSYRQDELFAGTSENLSPQTSMDSSRCTTSLALVDGPTRSSSPAGRKMKKSGPGAVHVSRFRALDSEKAMPTNAISGPLFSGSSPSESLQSSLESRLRARMDVNGSPEYALIWKHWDMPSGPRICALRSCDPRNSGKGFIGWPTVTVRDARTLKGGRDRPFRAGGKSLLQVLLDLGFKEGYLNPRFASWLMGYPVAHQSCGVTAMQSSRKSPRSSSKRQGRQ